MAWSQSLETVVPRSQPRLRSSGGKGVDTTNVSGARPGDRHRLGTTSGGRFGSFHNSAIDAGRTGLSFFSFFESSTPCFALENSSRNG